MRYIFDTTYPVAQKFLEKNDAYMSGHHMGTDFACPTGTEIFAPFEGQISKVFKSHPQMGNCIFFTCHKDGQLFTLRFMHLSAVLPEGNYKEGDLIAISGNTGNSTGPHLHVDVTRGEFNIQNLYTYEGVVANLVDFETWCPTEYHKKPVEASVEPKIDDSKVLPQMSSVVSSKTIWLGFVIAILQAVPLDVLPLSVKTAITTVLGVLVIVNRFLTSGSLK